MFSETASWSGYFYDRLKNLVDAEATYVSVRQQSAKANLPKKVLSVADSASFAVRGATTAVVLWYGAPLPITALAALSLFPSNTFSYLGTKINSLSNKFNKWLSSDEQTDDSDLYKVSYKNRFPDENSNKSDCINVGSWLPSVKTLETAQYLVTNGLIFYQNLLPVNWLKIMTIEAIEQPLRWYYGGALPEYYTKHAIGDWVWTVSDISVELLQNGKLLNDLLLRKTYRLTEYAINNSNAQGTQVAVQRVALIYNEKCHQFFNYPNWVTNKNLYLIKVSSVITGLSMLGINTKTVIPLMLPLFFDQIEAVPALYEPLIQEANTSFSEGQLKWEYFIGNSFCNLVIGSDGTIYMGCDDYNLYAIYPDGSLRWKYLTGGTISLPVIGSDGTIYMGCDDYNLYAIYPNGDLRWKYLIKLSDQIYPAPTFLPVIGSDGTIYIGCGYNLYAIYPDGSLRWTWSNDIPAGIPVSPFLIGGDGTIYLAVVGEQFCWNYCNTCYMVAIYPDGSLKWNYLIGNYQPYDIAIIGSDGIICLTNNILTRNILISNILYAIYPNGSLRWSYSFSNQTSVSFLGGSDGTIYVGSQDGNLYAIYPDGSLKWKYLTVSPGWVVYPLVIGSDGIIYVGSLYGNLYAIYPDGSLKWKYPIGGGSLSSVMGSDGTLYVGTYGNLYAISAGLIPATPIPTSVYEHTKTFTQTPLSFETITSTPTRVCGLVSPFEYAYLSNMVYGEVESVLNDNFPGWKVVPTSISFSNGFYGQLFNKSGTYVFAVRGTDNIGNLLTDISLASNALLGVNVLANGVTDFLSNYLNQAINYLDTSLNGITNKCLTFTGHSLGAALAEVLAGVYKSSSVGFENPGAASYMKGQGIPTGNVTAYQASPNLIDTLDTSAISTIYRVFPPYTYPSITTQAINFILANVVGGVLPMGSLLGSNLGLQLIPEYIEYTLQQHNMGNILTQFNPVTGQPYVFSDQTNGWPIFSVQEGFSGFFLRSDLNSYYLVNRKTALVGSLLGSLENPLNTAYNFVITGSDNHDDLLWGSGDYDDVLDGKSGDDQYWAFNGMNSITDESGNDVYHFFTTNMQGITTINDGDGLGSITLDNYGNCNIQSRGIVLVNVSGAGNIVFAFYPNDPNTGCQPDSTFSSQMYGLLNNYHNNDIFFLQLSGQNLMIALNSIATSPSKYGTIVINNFQDGNMGISLNGADRTISNTKIYYVSVAAGEVLQCDVTHDSYLFGLIGSSAYMNYDNNPYNCVMVGNSDAANTFIFKSSYVKGQNVKVHSSATSGISTIQGYKSGDLIDVSAFNFSSVSFQQDVVDGQVTMTLSNGVTILLPSVYNNISYTVDGKNNLTFVPTIISLFNTTITPTVTTSPTPSSTSSDTTTISSMLSHTNTPTVTASPTPSPTSSDTTTISSMLSHTNIDTSTAAISSSETKSTESNNNRLYIWVAAGGSIAGVTATSALILYCYKKRQKNKSRILPSATKSPAQEISLAVPVSARNFNLDPEATITNPDFTRHPNTRFFSKLSRNTQAYAPTTEQSQSNPVPFSLSSPSVLDGRELYPHYEEAESRSHSPSSRPLV